MAEVEVMADISHLCQSFEWSLQRTKIGACEKSQVQGMDKAQILGDEKGDRVTLVGALSHTFNRNAKVQSIQECMTGWMT